jgi:hypothetical protein
MSYLNYVVANFWLSALLFYAPMLLCLYGYAVETWQDFQKDKADRDSAKYYVPSLTVGVILGRALLTIIPVANLFAAIFSVGPKVFGDFFRFIGRVFDQPIVPKRMDPPK